MIKIALLATLAIAMAIAEPSGHNYGHPNAAAPSFNEAGVHRYNAKRQLAVNAKAEYVGASSGTAAKYGVPGTGYGYNHHDGYNRGYDHGYNGGYAGYGGYGYSGHYAGYGGHYGAH